MKLKNVREWNLGSPVLSCQAAALRLGSGGIDALLVVYSNCEIFLTEVEGAALRRRRVSVDIPGMGRGTVSRLEAVPAANPETQSSGQPCERRQSRHEPNTNDTTTDVVREE